MAEEEKKISFGFSKKIKKSTLQIPPKVEEKKVDYIECLDEKAIKVLGGEESKNEELVIPMLGSKSWCDRILNKTDADIFETKPKIKENGESSEIPKGDGQITNGNETIDISKIKKEVTDDMENLPKTLEEQAANEIIQDLKSQEIKIEKNDLEVPVTEDDSLRGKQESTLEDYEQIPIDGFGLAVLRGMGWKPGKGIGKNEKLIASTVPELRPRGMGLGADKLTIQKLNNKPKTKEEEQLKIEKGSFVRIVNGKHSNNYGQIEGFDDGAGRFIVKMALSGEILSLNENVVEAVTKTDFAKNSKVLNATKFEEYKNKSEENEEKSGNFVTSESDFSEDEKSRKSRRNEKSKNNSWRRKKSKKRSKYSSDEESEVERKSRKRRSSSESDCDYKEKKSRKSKKNHRRESSAERSSRKNKKKDKEREKTRERRADYSESSERRHKKHKKSRSRSPRRR